MADIRTAAELLREALALIPDADHWLQGRPEAICAGKQCYCALGALNKATKGVAYYRHFVAAPGELDELRTGPYAAAVDALDEASGLPAEEIQARGVGVVRFNNRNPYEDVRAMFERAIKSVEKAEAKP